MEHSNLSLEEMEALLALLAGKSISDLLCQSLEKKGFTQVMSPEEYQKRRELKTLETQFALWQIANNAMRESWLRSLWESRKKWFKHKGSEESESEFDRLCQLVETKKAQLQTSGGESLEKLSQYQRGDAFYFRLAPNARRILWQWLAQEDFPGICLEQLSVLVNRFADYYDKLCKAGYVRDPRLACLAIILADRKEKDILESFLAMAPQFHTFLFSKKTQLHSYPRWTYDCLFIEAELLDAPTLDVESAFYYFCATYTLFGDIPNQYLDGVGTAEYLKRAIVAARLVKGIPLWPSSEEVMKAEVEVRLHDLTLQCQRLQNERWRSTISTALDDVVGVSADDLIHLMSTLNLLDTASNLERRLAEVKQELEIAQQDTELAHFLMHTNLYYDEREDARHASIGKVRNLFAKELVERFLHIREEVEKKRLYYFGLKPFQAALLACTPGSTDRLIESLNLVAEALKDWVGREQWRLQQEKYHIHRLLSFLMLSNCYPQALFHDFVFELYAH